MEVLGMDGMRDVTEPKMEEKHGTIEIQKGKAIVTNPVGSGEKATILPHATVEIRINDVLMKKETAVDSSDDITIDIKQKPPHWFTVEITKDKLQVFLKLNDCIDQTLIIPDLQPATKGAPKAIQMFNQYDVEEYSSIIMEHLYKLGVKVSVNASAIINELTEPTFEKIVIANGTPPTKSQDGFIEYLLSTNMEKILREEKGKIDFLNHTKIPTVSPGDTIARVHPPIIGKEGVNVFGEPIYPSPAKTMDIRGNRKVTITDSGEIIALEYGRPSITGNIVKYVDIVNTYTVEGDVDIKTGHIYFNGDVIIKGNVTEQMRVESLGNVYIYGNVFKGTIVSAQNIQISGNVVSSKIVSGQHGLFFSEVYKVIEKLYRTIKQLHAAVQQLIKAMSERGNEIPYGEVVAKLVEGKFKSIVEDTIRFHSILEEMAGSNIEIPVQLTLIQRILKVFGNYHQITQIEKETIKSIRYALKEVLIASEASITANSTISFHEANMSEIKTNGSILIQKKGVIHSTLFAGEDIVFCAKDGVVRGGKVEALKKVHAGIVGSELGARPSIYSGEEIFMEELIKAKIRIKHKTIKVNGPASKVRFTYDEKNEEIKAIPPVKALNL